MSTTIEYPKQHRAIVDDLMNGKFILSGQPTFDIVKENEAFYAQFFKDSFAYNLNATAQYIYLSSAETNENQSRDISIFVALLCIELDKEGRSFLDELNYSEFTFEDVDRLFGNSSYTDLISYNKQIKDKDARRTLVNGMARKNILDKTGDDRFVFTPAVHVFTEFAKQFVQREAVPEQGSDNLSEDTEASIEE